MGLCGSKKEENEKPKIDIIKNEDKKKDKDPDEFERTFPGNANYLNTDQFRIIGQQKEKSICKIMKNDNPIGTGFLCYIIGEYKKRKALITAYHVLGEEDLKIGNEIKLIFNDNKEKTIKLEDSRRIYANEKDDITIIEIIDKDNLNKNIILELDDSIYNNTDFKKFEDKSIYILHYPKGMFSSFSDGVMGKIENNIIYHKVATEHGSSGAPILNLDTLRVIGIHQAYDKEENYNQGIILKESIKNFNKENNKIKLTLKINKSDIGKKIYFLQNINKFKKYYSDVDVPKLNRDNIVVLIDGEICRYENYYKFPKEGIYNVTIYINYILKDCTALFCCCENIIDIDLSSFDTKNVTDMSHMFHGCSNLINLNLSSFDTKNVTNMSWMFYDCSNLINLNLSSFDTKNVTDMRWIFDIPFGPLNIEINKSSFKLKHYHMYPEPENCIII